MIETDILIIGSGIAGLSFALKVAEERPDLSVSIFCKSKESETNTKYAQGGIAVVLDNINDSYNRHIEDTLKAGRGFCKPEVVEMVIRKAPERLRELLAWGVKFDREASGRFEAGLEGGHSHSRVLHHKDFTGYEIERKLLQSLKKLPNINLYEHHFAIDLISGTAGINNDVCCGAYFLDQKAKTIKPVMSRITLLATGGSGQVYSTTTNPAIATGDGVAMAKRAGAIIRDMQYIQFHPTAFFSENAGPSFLISEAVRGFGAHLVNAQGLRFAFQYDKRGELATRDMVSKAIYSELLVSGDKCVYIDCRHLDKKSLMKHFPGIYNYCKDQGIDICKDLIPVVPAAHYQCGGIATGLHAETTIKNLYASGECSSSGLHGANRLASNSLLEAVVFSHEAALDVLNHIDSIKIPEKVVLKNYRTKKTDRNPVNGIRAEIIQMTSLFAGITKSETGLRKAKHRLTDLRNLMDKSYPDSEVQTDLLETKNLLEVALLIVDHSLHSFFTGNNLTKKLTEGKKTILQ